MKIKLIDTNIILANFASEYDKKIKKKNIFNFNEINYQILINNIVLCEFYWVLFKKTYKKIILKNKINLKNLSFFEAFKNKEIIKYFNSIFILICNSMKEFFIIEIDYLDLTFSIEKFKISPNDYLIWLTSNKLEIITGDEDFKDFLLYKKS